MIKWAWAAVLAVVVAAGGIFAVRALPEKSGPSIAVETVQNERYPIGGSTASRSTTEPKTTVVNVVAVDAAGNPAEGYTSVAEGRVTGCERSPASVGVDIVSCASSGGGGRTNVCWVTASRTVLLCGNTPWEKTLRVVRTDVAVGKFGSPESPQPWGLELDGGTKCVLAVGSSSSGENNLLSDYVCDKPGQYLLTGSGHVADRSKPVWTVQRGRLDPSPEKLSPPVEVKVIAAYFAAASN
ncbi:hypothetical protein ACFWNN_05810 [Lentzea sp. NPDC058450]|uniref:hypothetical protein n=1 Tax=Lentzea sp. NPDC058450 TaxID=3346505 RepID=UPI003666349F